MTARVMRIGAEEAGTELLRLIVGGARLDVAPALGFAAVSWQVDELERLALPLPLREFARQPKTGGIPLLYPFANRLRGDRCLWRGTHLDIAAVAGQKRDANGLPIHGSLVRFGGWTEVVTGPCAGDDGAEAIAAEARLAWDPATPAVAAIFGGFPFRHRLVIRYELSGRSLRVITRVEPLDGVMPIAFGWHPYFAFPTAQRRETLLSLPAREHIELDGLMLPERENGHLVVDGRFAAGACTLSGHVFDDLFRVEPDAEASVHPPLGGVRMRCEDGYRYLQVYAPSDAGFACLEPMTAPGAALSDALDLPDAAPDRPFEARFRLAAG
jgi:galactose mutarotase-like enzyme